MSEQYTKELPKFIRNTIDTMIDNYNGIGSNESTLKEIALQIVTDFFARFNQYTNNITFNHVFGYTVSKLAQLAVDNGTITIAEYMKGYAEQKVSNAVTLLDYGAFGDLHETLCRIAFVPVKSFIHASMLYVKSANKTDMVSRKLGRTEIAHNGKSWKSATLFDFMAGPFDAVIYGAYNKADIDAVYNLCLTGRYEAAVNYVANYSCVWPCKYDYWRDMDNLSRGKGITVKSGDVQTVYNSGKYDAFCDAIESGKFMTIADYLKRK